MKIIPKVSTTILSDLTSKVTVKGFDLIIHSELWLCNLTTLPITFGAPSFQLFNKQRDRSRNLNVGKNLQIMTNAENALLELSSILEFGDKGHSFISDNEDRYNNTEVEAIPNQQTNEVIGKTDAKLN